VAELAERRLASEDDVAALASSLRDALNAQHASAAEQAQALSGRLDALVSDHAAVAQRVEAVASDNDEAQRAVDAETRDRNAADDETRRHVAALAGRLEEVADQRWASEEDLRTLADRLREALAAQQTSATSKAQSLAARLEMQAAEHATLSRRVHEATAQSWASESDLDTLAARLEELGNRGDAADDESRRLVEALANRFEEVADQRWASEEDLRTLARRLGDALTTQQSSAASQTEALAARVDALSSDHAIVARRVDGAMSAQDDEVRELRLWSEQLQSDQDEGRRHIETLAFRFEEVFSARWASADDLVRLGHRVDELGRLDSASVEDVAALEERLTRTWAARQAPAYDVQALADRLERLADEQGRAVQRLDDVATGQNYAVRAVEAARHLVDSGREDALRRIDALKDRLERLEAALRD
jgi:chromosome segregation ATPase